MGPTRRSGRPCRRGGAAASASGPGPAGASPSPASAPPTGHRSGHGRPTAPGQRPAATGPPPLPASPGSPPPSPGRGRLPARSASARAGRGRASRRPRPVSPSQAERRWRRWSSRPAAGPAAPAARPGPGAAGSDHPGRDPGADWPAGAARGAAWTGRSPPPAPRHSLGPARTTAPARPRSPARPAPFAPAAANAVATAPVRGRIRAASPGGPSVPPASSRIVTAIAAGPGRWAPHQKTVVRPVPRGGEGGWGVGGLNLTTHDFVDKRINQLRNGGRDIRHESENGYALAGPLGGIEVFEGRAAGDAGEKDAEGVADCPGLEIRHPRRNTDGQAVDTPEMVGGVPELRPGGRHVMGFAQEVGEGKSEVEGGIAVVDDLVIEEDEMVVM